MAQLAEFVMQGKRISDEAIKFSDKNHANMNPARVTSLQTGGLKKTFKNSIMTIEYFPKDFSDRFHSGL